MKCPRCKGSGRAIVIVKQAGGFYGTEQATCSKCNGSGVVEATNEEWIRDASTEELAEWLDETFNYCQDIEHWQCDKCSFSGKNDKDGCIDGSRVWVEWLRRERK